MKEDKECTLTFCDGTHYDLSSLASASADYETVIGNTTYKLNVCRGVVSELWHLDDPGTVGGFINREDGDFSLGRVNTSLHISPSTEEPMLFLQDGSPCPTNPEERASTAIRFICSPADFHAGKPQLVAALPPLDSGDSCHFFFEWKTHVACPTNQKSELERGHYIAFGAILAIAVLTWFGGHTFYNRFYLKRRGLDQFPIPKLSLSLPSLPSLSSSNKSTSQPGNPRWSFGRRSRSQRGYTGIRADDNEEAEGFAGRFSLDDDEEDDDHHEDLTGTGHEDARVLGGETDAWRGTNGGGSSGRAVSGQSGQGKVGAHSGLVDL